MRTRRRYTVPGDNDPWLDVIEWGSESYDGYGEWGNEEVARHGNQSLQRWTADETLPSTIRDLRGALFFESRRWSHYATYPDMESERYVRALVRALRDATHGVVCSPPREFEAKEQE